MAPRGASDLDCKAHFCVYRSICHCLIFNMSSINSAITYLEQTCTETLFLGDDSFLPSHTASQSHFIS